MFFVEEISCSMNLRMNALDGLLFTLKDVNSTEAMCVLRGNFSGLTIVKPPFPPNIKRPS